MSSSGAIRAPWAHPRSRGENALGITTCTPAPGSSPLTRGKHQAILDLGFTDGLIPAHAGKTQAGRPAWARHPAHPRSRGENIRPIGFASIAAGSSPLTRGKLRQAPILQGGRGLIPAHAGKTAPARSRRGHGRAHPRSRGENSTPKKFPSKLPGSSPLTRGKLLRDLGDAEDIGLIPAHAGKTLPAALLLQNLWAHPRSRGENTS